MELKNILQNLNTLWVRWSDYEIAENRHVLFIMPTKSSDSITYDCAGQAEQMVVDALNAGQRILCGLPDAEISSLDFARRYGLLGIRPSLSKAQKLFFGDSPTGKASAADASPVLNGVFSKSYGEPLERFQDKLAGIYAHFLAAHGGKNVPLGRKKLQEAWERGAADESGRLDYQLTFGENPELLWKPQSLLTVLRLGYAYAVTDPAAPLKLCRFCGKAYYNTNPRSEFCSATCRNHYNVNTFRKRQKEKKETNGEEN